MFLFLSTIINVILGGYVPKGCKITNNQDAEFLARRFYYPYANLNYSYHESFLAGGYLSILTPSPVITGVTDPFFKMYGTAVPFCPSWKLNNFSVELTGYYVVPQTRCIQIIL